MVMLCDYMTRKFQRRLRRKCHPSETSSAAAAASTDVTDDDYENAYLVGIEDALHSRRTKLKASHARSRITAQVSSIDALLPSSVRQNDKLSSRMIVSAWVNFRKSTYVHSRHVNPLILSFQFYSLVFYGLLLLLGRLSSGITVS